MTSQAIKLDNEYLNMIKTMHSLVDGQPIKAVGYTRVSTGLQPKSALESQEAVIREFAKLNGIEVEEVYSDRGISGTTDQRPEFQQMIKHVKDKDSDIQMIIVYKLDRFFRNELLHHVYDYELGKCGVFVLSATEQTYKDDMGTRVLKAVNLINNENEATKIRQNVKRGQTHTAKQGKTNGGIAPLGYDINEDGKYIINEAEAEIIRKIFKMRADGMTYEQMAKELNRLHYKTKIGRAFTKNSFYEIITNPKYKGVFIYNRSAPVTEYGKRPNRHKHKSSEETIVLEGQIDAIVSEALWDSVQPRKNSKITTNKGKYLLSGLITCPVCGASYQVDTKKGVKYLRHNKGKTIECINSRLMDVVESEVVKKAVNKIFSKVNTTYFINNFNDISKSESSLVDKHITKLNIKISALRKKKDNLLDSLSDTSDKAVRDDINSKLERINKEISAHTKKIQDLKKSIPQNPTKEEVLKAKSKLKSYILNPDNLVDANKLLREVIDCVHIVDGGIEINFKV